VLIIGDKLYCANIGDSRAILCRNGKALDLSVDHKAKRPDEQERIKS
jgi:serine/threonine protein phosphatase PrpC